MKSEVNKVPRGKQLTVVVNKPNRTVKKLSSEIIRKMLSGN